MGRANSLWVESSPGQGDFQPIEIGAFGTAVLFWGNQCEHYSVPNTTNTTRLSLDLRVIRPDLFVEDYIAPANKRKYGTKAVPLFRVGAGYTSATLEAEWLDKQKHKHLEVV